MTYYTQQQIDQANRTNLADFLLAQGEQLEKSGKEFRWKRHDSLTVCENKWFRHSRHKGGHPIDFVMEFFCKSFTEAVAMLLGEVVVKHDTVSKSEPPQFRLPRRSENTDAVFRYLTHTRCVDENTVNAFLLSGDMYEDERYHNVLFVGRDTDGIPRYAHCKSTDGKHRADIKGSDKSFGFCHVGNDETLFVFESSIDMLSFISLFSEGWEQHSYLSLGGVAAKALLQFISDHKNINEINLCLDSDTAGQTAETELVQIIPDGYTVNRYVPCFKDWNEICQRKNEVPDGKYVAEAVCGVKQPPEEETVHVFRMADIELQTVEWLWNPYIPFGKVTIIQGNPGEGKTTFALRLAASCSTGTPLPNMEPFEPFNVLYQTAEDGLGDTIKPRLIEAEADLNRVMVIDESDSLLSLSDARIEKAIVQNNARLIILDPIQAYLGDKIDINRANEIRPIIRRLGDVAERTGCAVILIGHLNKACGTQSSYRGLGSIDFRASARSVLLIGRIRKEPNVRVIVHDKSSLAAEGKSIAFNLGNDEGFYWLDGYDNITADDLLGGLNLSNDTKTAQAVELIRSLLSDGKEILSDDIFKAAKEIGISERTVNTAKKSMPEVKAGKQGNKWTWSIPK